MKKILILAIAAFALHSCNGKPSNGTTEAADSAISESAKDEHNAKNSLDYEGTYVGVIAIANGKSISVTIILTKDTFSRTVINGKDNSTATIGGMYTWDTEGSTITLEGIEAPNQYFVGENTLIAIDTDGVTVSNGLSGEYVLIKQ